MSLKAKPLIIGELGGNRRATDGLFGLRGRVNEIYMLVERNPHRECPFRVQGLEASVEGRRTFCHRFFDPYLFAASGRGLPNGTKNLFLATNPSTQRAPLRIERDQDAFL